MPPPSTSRPQAKQYRSSGWAWPLLVNVQVQKDKKASNNKRPSSIPKPTSAKPSMPDLREKLKDLSQLREEQSEPATSPVHSPGSPEEGSVSGHRTEDAEIVDGVADDEPGVEDVKEKDDESDEQVKQPRDDGHNGQDDQVDGHKESAVKNEHHPEYEVVSSPVAAILEAVSAGFSQVVEEANAVVLPSEAAGEPEARYETAEELGYLALKAESVRGSGTQDEEQRTDRTSRPTVERVSSNEHVTRFGKSRDSLRKADGKNDATSLESRCEDSLSNSILGLVGKNLPSLIKLEDVIPGPTPKSSPDSDRTNEATDSDGRFPSLIAVEEKPPDGPQPTVEPAALEEGPSTDDREVPIVPAGAKEADGLEPVSERIAVKEEPSTEDQQSPLTSSKGKEPDRARSIPRITIQRPSHSDISDDDNGEVPCTPLPTPVPGIVENPLSLENGFERRPITPDTNVQDMDRIVREIATDMASLEPNVPDTKGVTPKVALPINLKVTRRMKVRGKIVRGPMLQLLLGRQLAGPTKEALRLSVQLPDATPAVPDVANALLHSSVLEGEEAGNSPSIVGNGSAGPSSAGASSHDRNATGKAATIADAYTLSNLELNDATSTPESQQVWMGRSYQADFLSSLPGMKQFCRALQRRRKRFHPSAMR